MTFFGGYERELIASVVLMASVLLLRAMVARAALRYEKASVEVRRRWVAVVRTVSIAIVVFGLFSIWAEELRTLAVSLIAFAVAAVIATKELILCASGALVRAAGNAYGIGDRVEIAGTRGEVIDQSVLTTTLLEMSASPVHQFTGRTVVIPNSVLLSTPVVNDSYNDQVDLHVIRVPLRRHEPWETAERLLLDAARNECSEFVETARLHLRRAETILGLEALSVEPRVSVSLPDPDTVVLLLRVASPPRRKGQVEQAILRRYLRARDALAETPHDPSVPPSGTQT